MADEVETGAAAESKTLAVYHPKNLINGISRIFGGTIDTEEANPRGEALYMLLGGYVLGNSIGTNNTLKGSKRYNIGPVYFW